MDCVRPRGNSTNSQHRVGQRSPVNESFVRFRLSVFVFRFEAQLGGHLCGVEHLDISPLAWPPGHLVVQFRQCWQNRLPFFLPFFFHSFLFFFSFFLQQRGFCLGHFLILKWQLVAINLWLSWLSLCCYLLFPPSRVCVASTAYPSMECQDLSRFFRIWGTGHNFATALLHAVVVL